MRLTKGAYLATQQIYYPGFTIGGISESAGLLAMLVLLFATQDDTAFWLTLGASLCFAATIAAYWGMTHPINKYWLKDMQLKGAGSRFFEADPLLRKGEADMPDWTKLRDRWELSHVIRAVLSFVGFRLLATAVAL